MASWEKTLLQRNWRTRKLDGSDILLGHDEFRGPCRYSDPSKYPWLLSVQDDRPSDRREGAAANIFGQPDLHIIEAKGIAYGEKSL